MLVDTPDTAQLGLEPRDEFEIKLGYKQIKFIPLGAAGIVLGPELLPRT